MLNYSKYGEFLEGDQRVGFIPDEIIETVRQRSDIVEVVSRFVQLKKKGRYFTGSCPFHSERVPSFTVTQDKQIFHCFGCNVGGDVIKFLMLKENLTFYEAVVKLAEEAGISIPSTSTPAERQKDRKRDSIQQVNSLARDFFQNVLHHHPAAVKARQYLAGRGLSPEMIERFQIGYAFPEWDSLLKHLAKQGFKPERLAEAGLVVKRDNHSYYDRFRDRIMFPIWDAAGRVVGFGGRVLDQSLPKYMNTSETLFFNKSRILYGIHLARPGIREKGYVVVMEGYTDVITAHQHGVTNAVASLGTALTADQGRLLLHYSRNIIVAYDADSAGIAATIRGLDTLQDLGCQVRVVSVPDGKDPDEFLKKKGYHSWEKLVDQASSLIEYKLARAVDEKPVKTVSDKLEVMQKVFPNLVNIKNEVGKEEGLKDIARVLNLSWETVLGDFRRFEANLGKKWANSDNIAKTKHNILNKGVAADARSKAERVILRVVLEQPALVEMILEEMGEEPFKQPDHRRIFKQCLKAAHRDDYQPAEIFKYLGDEEHPVLSMILTQEIPGANLVQILKDLMDSISRMNRQERRETLLSEISLAEKSGDRTGYDELLQEYIVLRGIAEAEKSNDEKRYSDFLEKYREIQRINNQKHPGEGSDII